MFLKQIKTCLKKNSEPASLKGARAPGNPLGRRGSLGFEATLLPVVLSQQPLPAFPMLPGDKKGPLKRSRLLPPLPSVLGWALGG